ncbi:uncharacterized protein LOC110859698 [Folsomia candida]|uniref:Uncharacterized protein n=1 Tax=Folsomia candida TaxID=158441 RepID=A0A226D8T2_FOLCA|nr:uncharacterized protein LOC110859698 [Folsomia candida]OXA41962.1 hypothetical protein Fcan01_23047 [Folsomia candida]
MVSKSTILIVLAVGLVCTANGQGSSCKDKCWQYLQCKNSWYNYFNSPSTESLCTKPIGCSCACMTGTGSAAATTTVAATQAGTCGRDCSTFLSCKYTWEIYHGMPSVVKSFCKDPAGCACGAICYDQATATTAPSASTTVAATTTLAATTTMAASTT